MTMSAVKEKISAPKKERKQLKRTALVLIRLAICFLSARTSLFFELRPFGISSVLALGGGPIAYIGAMLGYFSCDSFEGLFYTTVVYIMKIFIKNEKADCALLLVGGAIVYAAIILQGGFLPYSVILRFISVIVTAFSYFPIKKGYKAQFKKPFSLKFTKKEGYCSLFLLFTAVLGIGNETTVYLLNISDIAKIYIIAISAYIGGIGGGSAAGAVLGILSGESGMDCAVTMALYSLFGFFSGIFSKFTKFTAMLGLFCSYIFACIYIETTAVTVGVWDMAIAGALFLITPSKHIKKYFARYSKKEPVRDMMSAVNSITASRLSKLADSFSGLSEEIDVSKGTKNEKSLINVNPNSLCDFLGDKVCHKCTLKNICWQKEYDNTAASLGNAVVKLREKGTLLKDDFDGVFIGRCVHLDEVVVNCRNFYDILKVNAVWKSKMGENTRAFKQQFIEMSKIICNLKENIEKNKYFEAELSGELYAALSEEGFCVKEVFVIKDASDTFYVKLTLFKCRGGENCIPKIKEIISGALGVNMIKSEGGCGDSFCTLYFKEGAARAIEKRIHSIAKNPDEPIGDSCKICAISPSKYLIALCDGMGSGTEASKISESVINLTEQMLKAGFSEEAVYKMINSFILANLSVSGFSTLDFIVADTKNMTGKIVKNGACPTYIKHKDGEVVTVKGAPLPVGITEQKPFIKTVSLKKDDMIVMVSDGAFDACEDKLWIYKLLGKSDGGSITDTVDLICNIAQKDFETKDDDITVLGVKIA